LSYKTEQNEKTYHPSELILCLYCGGYRLDSYYSYHISPAGPVIGCAPGVPGYRGKDNSALSVSDEGSKPIPTNSAADLITWTVHQSRIPAICRVFCFSGKWHYV
jgi:hypothetical protein